MSRTLLTSLFLGALVTLVPLVPLGGCSSSSTNDQVGSCAKPDPKPGCCMNYGGWTTAGAADSYVCDGMPYPSDPAWHLVKDDHGCDMWSSAGATGPVCYGPVDTGIDVRPDVDTDAKSDVPLEAATGHCCSPDPKPGCCMNFGGWVDADGGFCGASCDGMPGPGDPAWHLVKDTHGCDVWSSEGSTGPRCGAAPDAGRD